MLKRLDDKVNTLLDKYRLRSLKDVIFFMLITIVIHFSWRGWAYDTHYWPIGQWVKDAQNFLAGIVYMQSSWFNEHILGLEFTTADKTMYFVNNGYVAVNRSCSGLKLFTQWTLLMMLYPGPWKKKLWYIPMGILIVHLTNLFRIIGLSVIVIHWPRYWDFSHDYLFRPFFYVVIFTMWVIWVERFGKPVK
jgi:exosortase/archaeosortase family protein